MYISAASEQFRTRSVTYSQSLPWAVEIEADIILAARAVDGVYDSDPAVNPQAVKYDTIKMSDIVEHQLGVVDLAAAVLCMENKMPMCVFKLNEKDSIINTVSGACTGTIITVD